MVLVLKFLLLFLNLLVLLICVCRLKIFVPIAVLAWAVLVPVNWTNNTLELARQLRNVTSSDIDKLSVSNIPEYSMRWVQNLYHLFKNV